MAEDETKLTAETPNTEATAVEPAEAEEEDERIPFEILETIPQEGSVVQYKVSIARERLAERSDELYKELGSSVSIEGFRRGKAPRRLLQIRYGKEIEKDAIGELAGNITSQLIKNEGLDVIGDPDLKDFTAEEGKPVEIVIEIERQPSVELKDYTGLEVEVDDYQVDDAMVEKRLQQLREANAQFESAPEGAVYNPGDGAVVDYEVLDKNGIPLQNMSHTGSFLGSPAEQLPEEIAGQLAGKKAGDEISAEVTSHHTTRRGEQRTSTDKHILRLKEIKIKRLPDLDDEFAKDLGDFETLAELKEHVRNEIEATFARATRRQAIRQLHDKILENNAIDAPRTLVGQTTINMINESARHLHRAGMSLDMMSEVGQRNYLRTIDQDAVRAVKVRLALDAIARQEKLEVSEQDVEEAIARVAEAEGRRPLAIRARLEREKQLDAFKADLLSEKANSFLMDKNSMKKVPPKPKENSDDPAEES